MHGEFAATTCGMFGRARGQLTVLAGRVSRVDDCSGVRSADPNLPVGIVGCNRRTSQLDLAYKRRGTLRRKNGKKRGANG